MNGRDLLLKEIKIKTDLINTLNEVILTQQQQIEMYREVIQNIQGVIDKYIYSIDV